MWCQSVHAPLLDTPSDDNQTNGIPLPLITEDTDDHDFVGNDHESPVEFDFLSDPTSLDIMTISGSVFFYSGLNYPLCSVHRISSSRLT